MNHNRTTCKEKHKAYASWSVKLLAALMLLVLNANAFADSADPADPATWTVTPSSYAYDMTMTAVLYFDLQESTDPNDRIAAFHDGDCRGVEYTRTVVEGRYLAYLRIYGNSSSGDTITLYIYDSSEDKVVEVVEKVAFVPQANYGTQNSPYKASVTFDVNFTVESEGTPIPGAVVTLEGYGEEITDASGEVVFADVPPTANMHYSVEKGDYFSVSGEVTVDNADVNELVEIELKTYTLTVEVIDGSVPVSGIQVSLEGYGTKTTNVYGKALFKGVFSEIDMEYEISGVDYYTQTGTIEGLVENSSKKIVLNAKTYNITVRATDAEGPVQDLELNGVMNGEDRVEDFFSDILPSAFETYGNGDWTVTADTMLQGEYAVQSAQIFDNQESVLRLEQYMREGYISFFYKVSSEENNDVLLFELDGQKIASWSGEVPWEYFKMKVSGGTHTLEWKYVKDGNYSSGADAAWVDYIETPAADSVVQEAVTDASGEAVLYNIKPYNLVLLDGYSSLHEEYTDSLGEIRNDTIMDIALTRVYDLEFSVYSDEASGSIPVKNAIIEIIPDRNESTDYNGYATFDRVSIGTQLYTISAEGYYDLIDSVELVDGLVTVNAILELIPQLKAANVITPNGDGYNDYWEIYNIENYASFTVSIYSAMGELLYTTTDYENNKWNGKAGNRVLPDGIYYYMITSPHEDMVFEGIINLIIK